MIVSVCADKGAPGVTTLAAALAVVWPGEKVLVEADPSGADLPFRLRRADSGTWLAPEPSLGSLAAVARLGTPPAGPAEFAQPCTLGFPVIPGALSAERFAPLRSLWPHLTATLSGWPGTVIADLGRLQPGHPGLPIAKASTVVLLLARADLAGLFHLRDRVVELGQAVGDPNRDGNPVVVVVTGPGKTRTKSLTEAADLLASIGSPASVAGFIPEDRQGAADLWAGAVTRRMAGSDLMRAARQLAQHLLNTHPDLAEAAATTTAEAQIVSEKATFGPTGPPEGRAAPAELRVEEVSQ